MKAYRILIHNPFDWKDTDSYLPLAIRLFTGKYYNHAGVGIGIDSDNIHTIIHAIGKGVVDENWNEWLSSNKRDIKIEEVESSLTHDKIIERAISKIGTPYDKAGILKLLLVIISRKLFNKDFYIGRTDEYAYARVMCYELVNWCFGLKDAYKAMPEL